MWFHDPRYDRIWIETEVNRVLAEIKSPRRAGTVITRVEVDEHDPRMSNPTKPIGPFYTKEEAEQLQQANPESTYKEMLDVVTVKWYLHLASVYF